MAEAASGILSLNSLEFAFLTNIALLGEDFEPKIRVFILYSSGGRLLSSPRQRNRCALRSGGYN